jgi:feruloyl esterase
MFWDGSLTDLFFSLQDTASLGVDFERNHCRYPRRNTCVDPENYKKPEAWKCV